MAYVPYHVIRVAKRKRKSQHGTAGKFTVVILRRYDYIGLPGWNQEWVKL